MPHLSGIMEKKHFFKHLIFHVRILSKNLIHRIEIDLLVNIVNTENHLEYLLMYRVLTQRYFALLVKPPED